MKKNFVKYFGVASTTLLAVAPVATPALMTASNLAVVKAGVQDDITAGFKADNSLVQLTDEQWKGLTSTFVNEKPVSLSGEPASQAYLDELRQIANKAKKDSAEQLKTSMYQLMSQYIATGPISSADLIGGKNPFDYASTNDAQKLQSQMTTYYVGNGRNTGSIRKLVSTPFNQWYGKFSDTGNTDSDHPALTIGDLVAKLPTLTGSPAPVGYTPTQIANAMKDYVLSLPEWWFLSREVSSNDFQVMDGIDGVFKGKKDVFTRLDNAPAESTNNGLVTVAPNGGVAPTSEDYLPDDSDLSFVGDNLVDLQKRTDNELLNLVPSNNRGQNKSGSKFSDVQGEFRRSGGTIIADGRVSDGSKVWSTILQSVLNPRDAMYPLKDLTTSNIVKTKMLVNGKDATKNEFITKDEIQNADRISIQFVFKTNDGNEYKSPTIWLSHGAKYTVNTSGLANVTRLPGDFYRPSAGITGSFNETGLPMDRDKFVVVPAGTDLANYTDKNGMVDLAGLAALQGGILGTNGVAVNRNFETAVEGGQLSDKQYWTRPNYIYSKFGTYNDAVDIYYVDGSIDTGKTSTQITKSQSEYRSEAAAAVSKKLADEIVNNKALADDTAVQNSNVWGFVKETMGSYLQEGKDISASSCTIIPNISTTATQLTAIFPLTGTMTARELRNKLVSGTTPVHAPNGFPSVSSAIYKDITVNELFADMISKVPLNLFKEDKATVAGSSAQVASYQLNKVVANAARTTKVDVPSKYLPQVSFNNYKGATYYENGSTINNWFNYSWNSGSAANSGNDPYYPSGGVIVTGGTSAASSSAAKQPISYLAPAAFAANSISAEQLQARVSDNIQKFMTAKLSNPNTEENSKADGYFKGYEGVSSAKGDAAYAYIKNGAVPSSDLKIDTSKVDVTKPGTYYVEVTYTPLNTIKSNTLDGSLGETNGNVGITDQEGRKFSKGILQNTKFVEFPTNNEGATASSSNGSVTGSSKTLTTFAADQIFANGAPATYKLPVQITDGSNAPQTGAPVIAFTEGGQNLKIAKGGTFDQFKGLQFYAYPGAKAWDQKDDSVKVEVSGKVNTNVEGTYTLVYTVTNKAGKSSTLTRVITVGDGVEKPTEYEFNLSQAYIDYVPGYNVREYGYPGDEWTGKQIKHGTSVSVTKRAVFQNGEEWYKLGDGNWVKKQYVKAGQNPNEAVEARGVVTVNYVPGYGIAVYKEPGKSALVQVNGKPKRLAHGTSWKSFKKQTVNNVTYYNVGGNQWVNGNFVIFK